MTKTVMDKNMDEEGLIDLQTRFAHQQDELMQITDTLMQQQRAVDVLKGAVSELQRQLRDISEQQSAGNGAEPPPPHY